MGYTIAALGELSNAAVAKAPTGGGKKTKEAWSNSLKKCAKSARVREGRRRQGSRRDQEPPPPASTKTATAAIRSSRIEYH